MRLTTILAVLLATFTVSCSDNGAQGLYKTAQFEGARCHE